MSRNILYTYKNREEFERLYSELLAQDNEIHSFVYQEAKNLIEDNSDIHIDITLMVEAVSINKSNRLPAQNNLN